MTRTVLMGALALVLSVASAWAGDSKAEIDFVTRASVGNLFALAEARLALERTGNTPCKEFARRLVDEHAQAEAKLETAATGSGARVATDLDQAHQARLTALQGKSGASFDQAFLADQAETHSNALTLYADYMLLGDNPRLKAMATAMIPIAQAQFKAAQALAAP